MTRIHRKISCQRLLGAALLALGMTCAAAQPLPGTPGIDVPIPTAKQTSPQQATPTDTAPAPATQQSTPATSQPATQQTAPAPSQPAPTTQQPAPAITQPAPTTQQPAPATSQPAPATQQAAPTTSQPAPTTQQPAPATQKPAPSASQTAPATQQTKPASNQPAAAKQPPKPADQAAPAKQQAKPAEQAAPAKQAAKQATKPQDKTDAAKAASTVPVVIPSWFAQGKPTKDAQIAVKALLDAESQGLNPKAYRAAELSQALKQAGQAGADPSATASLDQQITESLIRYMRDLHQGRLSPKALKHEFKAPALAGYDPRAIIADARQRGTLEQALKDAVPKVPMYESLRKTMNAYRAMGTPAAWRTELPALPGKSLEPGATWAGLETLAARLKALGDLRTDATLPTTATPPAGAAQLTNAVKSANATRQASAAKPASATHPANATQSTNTTKTTDATKAANTAKPGPGATAPTAAAGAASTANATKPASGTQSANATQPAGAAQPADAQPLPVYDGEIVEAVKRFQARHGLQDDGIVGPATLAQLNVTPAQRVKQMALTLERLRWTPLLHGERMIAVNVPEFVLRAYETSGTNIKLDLEMRVIVGSALDTRTPIFMEDMRFIEFSPYWNIPRSIAKGETLPRLRRDPAYFSQQGFEFVTRDNAVITELSSEAIEATERGEMRIRQRPGPRNALGDIKFIFPNDQNIYLHSTPAPQLFSRVRRDFSHGCIRIEEPVKLAQFVLRNSPEWTTERIKAAMGANKSRTIKLENPIPVLIAYSTAVVRKDGKVAFFPDIYQQDARLEKALRDVDIAR